MTPTIRTVFSVIVMSRWVLDILRVAWMRARINLWLRVKDLWVKEAGKGYMRHVMSAKQFVCRVKGNSKTYMTREFMNTLWWKTAKSSFNAWVLIHSSVKWKQDHSPISAPWLPTNNKAFHWVVRDHMFIPYGSYVVSLCYDSALLLVRLSGIAVFESSKVKLMSETKS